MLELLTNHCRGEIAPALLMAVSLLLASCFSSNVSALVPGRTLSQLGHRVWLSEDGLPQNTIQALAQTRDGYIWMGTQEGLVRFDGVRFRTFDRRNTPAMRSNFVRALLESHDGGLWVATDGGLVRLLSGEFTSYTTRDGLSHDFVRALCETSDGSLWVGTAGGGLDRLRDNAFTHYTTRQGLLNGVVNAL